MTQTTNRPALPHEGEAYYKLVGMIKERHPCDEREAHRLARNLMGYTELAIRVNHRAEQEARKKAEIQEA